MPDYRYDLHIHSCLSPCGEGEMTPPNIANMAAVLGLDLIAITDHNSARNAAAVAKAAQGLPLTVIAGLELTTAEEIHVVCLFPDIASAEAAGEEAEALLPDILNDEEIFGIQQIADEAENELGRVDKLLINATSVSIDDAAAFAAKYGGFCYPAHIDKQANSLLAAFGCLPEHLALPTVEVAHPEVFLNTTQGKLIAERCHTVTSSDAHMLATFCREPHSLRLPSPDFSSLRELLCSPLHNLNHK